jgi:hypothetical protein
MERGRKRSRKLCAQPESLQNSLGQAFAALAGERKGFHHHRADFLFHIVAQHGPRPVQPRLHGLRFQVEQFGGLLDIHSLDHAGDEDDAWTITRERKSSWDRGRSKTL